MSFIFKNTDPSNLGRSLLEGNKDHLLSQRNIKLDLSIIASVSYSNTRTLKEDQPFQKKRRQGARRCSSINENSEKKRNGPQITATPPPRPSSTRFFRTLQEIVCCEKTKDTKDEKQNQNEEATSSFEASRSSRTRLAVVTRLWIWLDI